MFKDVSILIPVYNAQTLIENALGQLLPILQESKLNYEVLLRDDGSSDSSVRILNSVHDPRVKVFFNHSNEGLGATLRKLFDDAKGRNVIYCDCDLPYGVEIIPKIFKELSGADIVVASRYGEIKNRIPMFRFFISRTYYSFCRFLLNIRVVDIGSGSVGIRKDILKRIHFRSRGFGIHAELYAKGAKLNIVLKEISAASNYSKVSSFSIFKHGPHIIKETLQLWQELKTAQQ